jgi:hypothetical protein
MKIVKAMVKAIPKWVQVKGKSPLGYFFMKEYSGSFQDAKQASNKLRLWKIKRK